MKINIRQIPQEGFTLEEEIPATELDVEAETVNFLTPIKVKAEVSMITNTVIAKLSMQAKADILCSRCLKKFTQGLDKKIQLEYVVDTGDQSLDLNPDIRQEIILDHPIKFLCEEDCKGLCLSCGGNLNEGQCACKDAKIKVKNS